MYIVGLYASPNAPVSSLQEMLDRIRERIAPLMSQDVLILGDFNAKSKLWGSPKTDHRGEAVVEWAGTRPPATQRRERKHLRSLAGRVHCRSDMGLPVSGTQREELESRCRKGITQ